MNPWQSLRGSNSYRVNESTVEVAHAGETCELTLSELYTLVHKLE